jgi:hypothetical protein
MIEKLVGRVTPNRNFRKAALWNLFAIDFLKLTLKVGESNDMFQA